MELGELRRPRPGPSDLLVRVMAASINPVDTKTRQGKLKVIRRYRFPLIWATTSPAWSPRPARMSDDSKSATRCSRASTKDRIGSFAEYALVSESAAAAKPKNLSHTEAASIPLVGLTAWQALVEIGQLQKGQKVLIQPGAVASELSQSSSLDISALRWRRRWREGVLAGDVSRRKCLL